MWELFAIPLVSSAAALWVGTRKNDKNRMAIEKVFKNMKVGAIEGKEFVYPKLIKKEQHDNFDRYTYRVPVGLPSKVLEPLQEIISATLDAPVEVTFKKWLYVDVFRSTIPDLVPYKDVPDQEGWVVPLGKNEKGWHFHDFDKTPHMTNSGTARFGKTVFLKVMMTYLIEHHPEDVEFFIIDMKGGLEFERYRYLRQVIDVASDPFEALEVLEKVKSLLEQKMTEFKQNHWTNVVHSPYKKRLFIIVDEAAQLVPEPHMNKTMKNILSYCQNVLSEVARIGGALGFRLVFCTQYPTADTLPRQIKQNADIKISFRLPTGYASQVAIDDYGAEKLPSAFPGRAIIKTHEMKIVQTPLIDDEEMMKRLGRYQVAKPRKGKNEGTEDFVHFG
ncbi:cell division protein FtsK [Parageobacillus genomosp. 1]|uniref:Cell division protein FtsK n=1 Tax=Parageobacillus genomosp. 1 TaxID=1295642 RepID=A0ABC9VGS7_9BACL|nr:FtsK/SpoIIIE domain-containing protein [Parageobacillus genomosp. 1]EZP77653.1 cell division protein FtsK [Parageobacillus genomosp. 1]